jgi:hypothetical protein
MPVSRVPLVCREFVTSLTTTAGAASANPRTHTEAQLGLREQPRKSQLSETWSLPTTSRSVSGTPRTLTPLPFGSEWSGCGPNVGKSMPQGEPSVVQKIGR